MPPKFSFLQRGDGDWLEDNPLSRLEEEEAKNKENPDEDDEL